MSHFIDYSILWFVIGILRLTTANTKDTTPLSDQITRVEYGVQFSAMEAVRFPQLNFNLNLILDIPQVSMPTEQKKQCDETDATCRSYNLCDKLFGIHQTTSEPVLCLKIIQHKLSSCGPPGQDTDVRQYLSPGSIL